MTTERDQFPEHFTFSQRNGYEALPEPMKLKQLSADLRRELSNAVRQLHLKIHDQVPGGHRYVKNYIDRTLGRLFKISESEIIKETFDYHRSLYFNGQLINKEFTKLFNKVLDLLEIMLDEIEILRIEMGMTELEFPAKIRKLFDKYAAPYWLDTSQRPYWFFPRSCEEEGEAVQQAIKTVHQGGMTGAATHLRKAAKSINVGEHADSIRESIHAVESVARTIDLDASKTLGPALSSLKKHGLLQHEALTKAFQQLYGYTCDEQGIRHALLDKSAADVGLEEAIFMFGACASFSGYLTQKHRQAQQKGGSRP